MHERKSYFLAAALDVTLPFAVFHENAAAKLQRRGFRNHKISSVETFHSSVRQREQNLSVYLLLLLAPDTDLSAEH